MATIVAVRSGNWSNTSHTTGPWPGGSTPTTKPGAGDTVQTGAYIVTIDEDVHVALLEATGGGYFSVTTAPTLPAVRTITASVLGGENEGTGALRISNPSGQVVLIGDVTGGVWENAWGIYNDGGTMGNITGDVTGGTMDNAWGIYNNGGAIGNITGDVTGGTPNRASMRWPTTSRAASRPSTRWLQRRSFAGRWRIRSAPGCASSTRRAGSPT